ncbi:hypothetical protein ACU4GD_43855 [Cupriavidus basilensis]
MRFDDQQATPEAMDLRLVTQLHGRCPRHGSVRPHAADSLPRPERNWPSSQHLRIFVAEPGGAAVRDAMGRKLELTDAGRQLVLALEPVCSISSNGSSYPQPPSTARWRARCASAPPIPIFPRW